jgi:acetyl-CoA acetyltransferase
LVALEELRLVRPSEAAAFVADGGIDIDGELPINPHGGLIGEAYIHGFNGLIEAVAQARGSAVNQVRDFEHVLVTGGPALPTSGLILGPA